MLGAHVLAAATKPTGTNDETLFLLVALFVVAMYFLFLRPQRRRQQNAQNMQRTVVNGSRVRTLHGIYGTVVDGDDRNVIVEVAPGVNIKMMRQAIGQVVPDDEPDGVLHTETDQSSGWSEDGSSEDGSSDEHSSDDHGSDGYSSDNHSSDNHSAEDQGSEERSDLGR